MTGAQHSETLQPAVEVSGLTVRYGDVVAVDDVSFAAERGEVVAMLGPNGAGKTTTVETCEGYRRPASGSVRVLGLDPMRDKRTLVSRIGVMLQDGGVYPAMSPLDAVRLFSSFYERSLGVDEALSRVGLDDGRVRKTPVRRLSGGEKQRLSLALALVGRPEVAFLDEPTAGIDPAGRLVIRGVIAALRKDGVCVVVTTHDLDEAERISDRIVIIDRGRILAAGTPAELTLGTAGDGQLRFTAAPGLDVDALSAALGGGVRVIEELAGEYHVSAMPNPQLIAAVTAWLAERNISLTGIRSGRTLEDVFLHLTASDPTPHTDPHTDPAES
jgi:ABC-2 type transport system ATP-binding protein